MSATVIMLVCRNHPQRTYSDGLELHGTAVICPDCGHGDNIQTRTERFPDWGSEPDITTWDEDADPAVP